MYPRPASRQRRPGNSRLSNLVMAYRISYSCKLAAVAAVSIAVIGTFVYQRANAIPSAKEAAKKALPAMAAELARAPKEFVLLAGDSHAAALRLPCDTVNVAVSGLKVGDVRAHLSELPAPVEPSAVLLVVGTNDVLRKHRPLNRTDEWIAQVRQIIGRFRNVVVTAIPPVGSELVALFDPDAIHVYSHRLENMCAQEGCLYLDPWKATRSRLFGEAKRGAMADSLHLADYNGPGQIIADVLCPKPPDRPGEATVMAE